MAKLGTTVLVAGLLAASANAAFADNREHKQPHPQNAATQNARDNAPISGITKDGKMVQLEISVPTLNKGHYTDQQFDRAIKGGLMMGAMQTMIQYNEADIPKNIGKIQQQITEQIGHGIPLGNVNGKPENAKPGVNYGNATITKVTDMISHKVVFEQKAPTTKPGTPKA